MTTLPAYRSPLVRIRTVSTDHQAHAILVFELKPFVGVTFEHYVIIDGVAKGLRLTRQQIFDELMLYAEAIVVLEDKLTFSYIHELPKLAEDFFHPSPAPKPIDPHQSLAEMCRRFDDTKFDR